MLHTKHNHENTACRQNSRRKRSKCRRRKRHAKKKRKQNGRQRQGKSGMNKVMQRESTTRLVTYGQLLKVTRQSKTSNINITETLNLAQLHQLPTIGTAYCVLLLNQL
jgi:hypothetical protein